MLSYFSSQSKKSGSFISMHIPFLQTMFCSISTHLTQICNNYRLCLILDYDTYLDEASLKQLNLNNVNMDYILRKPDRIIYFKKAWRVFTVNTWNNNPNIRKSDMKRREIYETPYKILDKNIGDYINNFF